MIQRLTSPTLNDAIARVVVLDIATGAVELRDLNGAITPILIQENELLLFGFNGQPVTASRMSFLIQQRLLMQAAIVNTGAGEYGWC